MSGVFRGRATRKAYFKQSMKKLLVLLCFVILTQVSYSTNLLSQADLLNQTRIVLGETDSAVSYWTNPQLRQYIQDAANILVKSQVVKIEKYDTIATTSNSYLYNLNTDFYQSVAVFRVAGKQLTPCQQVRPEEFFNVAIKYSDTLKLYYALFGNDSLTQSTPKILFRPSIENIDTFIVLYNAKPKFFAGADTLVNIQQPERTLIPVMAASLALRGASRHAEADAMLQGIGITFGKEPEKKTDIIPR